MKKIVDRIMAVITGYGAIIILAPVSLYETLFNKKKNEK